MDKETYQEFNRDRNLTKDQKEQIKSVARKYVKKYATYLTSNTFRRNYSSARNFKDNIIQKIIKKINSTEEKNSAAVEYLKSHFEYWCFEILLINKKNDKNKILSISDFIVDEEKNRLVQSNKDRIRQITIKEKKKLLKKRQEYVAQRSLEDVISECKYLKCNYKEIINRIYTIPKKEYDKLLSQCDNYPEPYKNRIKEILQNKLDVEMIRFYREVNTIFKKADLNLFDDQVLNSETFSFEIINKLIGTFMRHNFIVPMLNDYLNTTPNEQLKYFENIFKNYIEYFSDFYDKPDYRRKYQKEIQDNPNLLHECFKNDFRKCVRLYNEMYKLLPRNITAIMIKNSSDIIEKNTGIIADVKQYIQDHFNATKYSSLLKQKIIKMTKTRGYFSEEVGYINNIASKESDIDKLLIAISKPLFDHYFRELLDTIEDERQKQPTNGVSDNDRKELINNIITKFRSELEEYNLPAEVKNYWYKLYDEECMKKFQIHKEETKPFDPICQQPPVHSQVQVDEYVVSSVRPLEPPHSHNRKYGQNSGVTSARRHGLHAKSVRRARNTKVPHSALEHFDSKQESPRSRRPA